MRCASQCLRITSRWAALLHRSEPIRVESSVEAYIQKQDISHGNHKKSGQSYSIGETPALKFRDCFVNFKGSHRQMRCIQCYLMKKRNPHEPSVHAGFSWSWWTDLNPRPADYKPVALPAELMSSILFDLLHFIPC